MPFEPKYTITNKIVNNLTKIAAGREVIEQAKLIPDLRGQGGVSISVVATHLSR